MTTYFLRAVVLFILAVACAACGSGGPFASARPTTAPAAGPASGVSGSPLLSTPSSDLAQSTAAQASVSPTLAPSPVATSTPIPTATPISLAVGNTGGDGIWIRQTPGTGDKLKAWPDGTVMVVVGPDQTVDGQVWKNVKDPDGGIGWVAGEYLTGATAEAATGSTAAPTNTLAPAPVAPTLSATTTDPVATSTLAPVATATPIPLAARALVPTATATSVTNATPTPAPAAAATLVAAAVTFTSIVGAKPGQPATVAVQTGPGARCAIYFTTPDGSPTTEPGLASKSADPNGHVTWTWSIGPSTAPGSGSVEVDCGHASATTEIPIG